MFLLMCLIIFFMALLFGHIHARRLDDMVSLNLISKYANDMIDICQIWMQTKITRKQLSGVDITSSLLQLIQSDVCDMDNMPTRGGKNILWLL